MTYIPSKLRNLVAERAAHCCEYCQSQEVVLGMPFEIEHIVPLAAGGRTEEKNLCLACWRCNRYKGTQVERVDEESLAIVPLYHPRQHVWDEHFSWSNDGLRITGLTPTGRVAIEALKMNNPFVVRSRYRWVASGWHPVRLNR